MKYSALLLLLLIGILPQIQTTSAQTIVLEPTATVTRPYVTVGEVARIVSETPSVTAGLSSIFLGKAPGSYDREWILLRLSQSGVVTANVRFEGAAQVQVERGVPHPVRTVSHTLSRPLLSLPAPRQNPGGRGPVPAPAMDVRRDRPNPERGGQVAPDALHSVPVVVARRNLRPGAILGPDDLEIRSLAHRASHLSSTETLIGGRLSRVVSAGTPITHAMVRREPLVRPGMRVEVVLHGESFKIRAPGRVRTSGALGDYVPVRLVLNRKNAPREVIGRVTGRGLLEVKSNPNRPNPTRRN